jgi:hypothetical protein
MNNEARKLWHMKLERLVGDNPQNTDGFSVEKRGDKIYLIIAKGYESFKVLLEKDNS